VIILHHTACKSVIHSKTEVSWFYFQEYGSCWITVLQPITSLYIINKISLQAINKVFLASYRCKKKYIFVNLPLFHFIVHTYQTEAGQPCIVVSLHNASLMCLSTHKAGLFHLCYHLSVTPAQRRNMCESTSKAYQSQLEKANVKDAIELKLT